MATHPYRNIIPAIKTLLEAESDVTDIFEAEIYEGLEPAEYINPNRKRPFLNIFPEVRPIEIEYAHRREGELIVNIDVIDQIDITDNIVIYDKVIPVEEVIYTTTNQTLNFNNGDSARYQRISEVPAIDLGNRFKILGIQILYRYLQNK
jgi:hypothetical protein